jgi:hypothetical protein
MSIHVTVHAMERFVERCRPCTLAEAKAEILTHPRRATCRVSADRHSGKEGVRRCLRTIKSVRCFRYGKR